MTINIFEAFKVISKTYIYLILKSYKKKQIGIMYAVDLKFIIQIKYEKYNLLCFHKCINMRSPIFTSTWINLPSCMRIPRDNVILRTPSSNNYQ